MTQTQHAPEAALSGVNAGNDSATEQATTTGLQHAGTTSNSPARDAGSPHNSPDTAALPPHNFRWREHVIDGLMPVREVHLLGGPSGAGKTTWLMDFLEKWQKEEDIFGHKSHPAAFVYIAGD